MKLFLTIVTTAALGLVLGAFLPFWSLALAALVMGFILAPGAWRALAGGFLAGALLWGGLAWWADAANAGVLSARVATLFKVGPTALIALTALLGALLAGLGCLLGERVRKALA
jgi:hypothetical protein